MLFTPTYERVDSISKSLGVSWQEAHHYVGHNSPYLDDFLIKLLIPYEEKGAVMGVFFEFFSKPVVTQCFCEEKKDVNLPVFSGTYKQHHTINDIVVCLNCGTGRLPMIPTNYADYYSTGYFASKYKERLTDFDHELKVAEHRYNEIIKVLPKKGIQKVLDIGCAVGAFLNVLTREGIEAVGTEIYNPGNVYKRTLSDNIITQEELESKYPNGYFDVITIFDILEHVYDVKALLENVLPFLKHNGFLIIEVPNMGKESLTINDSNKHHIKLIDFEHIWYFTEKGLKTLLAPYKLVVRKIESPIKGKSRVYSLNEKEYSKTVSVEDNIVTWVEEDSTMVAYAENMGDKKIAIGLESGVGDAYWALLKLKDFKKKKGIEHLHAYVIDTGEYNRNGSLVENCDFIDSYSYAHIDRGQVKDGVSTTGYAYDKERGKRVRLDHFFCLSEILSVGNRIETWLPEYKIDWNMEVKTDKPKGFRKPKPMVVLFSSGESLGRAWMNGFMKDQWSDLVNRLNAECKAKPILVGAKWDIEYSQEWSTLVDDPKGFKFMVGETSLSEVLYLLKEADLVIGVISGMTILANHFKTPTIALYPGHEYKESFTRSWVPPKYNKYLPIKAGADIADEVIKTSKSFLKGK